MIVAKTLKGKGVSFVEDKEGWHGKAIPKGEQLDAALDELGPLGSNGGFQIEAPPAPSKRVAAEIREVAPPDYKIGADVASRSGYGAGLAKLGEANQQVVALDADVKNSTYAEQFMEKHADRYFEMFIAEQNLVGSGIGLSKCGKVPFVSSFAAFLTRSADQVRMSAISQANIKYVGSHAGISIGEDGPSQMGLEDLALFRTLPGSVVLYPSDAVAAERLVVEAARHDGIVYIRTSRPKTAVIYSNDEHFPIGGSKTLRENSDDQATVIGAGVTLHEALEAYEDLKSEGISIRVIDLYSVKPVDTESLLRAAAVTNNTLITVEDHYREGGLGDAVLDAVASQGIKVHKLAVTSLPSRSGKAR